MERRLCEQFPAVDSPAQGIEDITPSDSADLGAGLKCARFLWITGAGNVKVDFLDGTSGTFAVVADQLFPYAANGGAFPAYMTKVYATGTTATGIKAVW